jgi:hypothetical protein
MKGNVDVLIGVMFFHFRSLNDIFPRSTPTKREAKFEILRHVRQACYLPALNKHVLWYSMCYAMSGTYYR